jgi:hypothetical protein
MGKPRGSRKRSRSFFSDIAIQTDSMIEIIVALLAFIVYNYMQKQNHGSSANGSSANGSSANGSSANGKERKNKERKNKERENKENKSPPKYSILSIGQNIPDKYNHPELFIGSAGTSLVMSLSMPLIKGAWVMKELYQGEFPNGHIYFNEKYKYQINIHSMLHIISPLWKPQLVNSKFELYEDSKLIISIDSAGINHVIACPKIENKGGHSDGIIAIIFCNNNPNALMSIV